MTNSKIYVAIVWCVFSSISISQTLDSSMRFTTHDPCGGGNAEYCATVLVGRGVFDQTTLLKFKNAVTQHQLKYDIKPPATGISTIIFSSPGGSLGAGIAVGKEIRKLKMATTAVSTFKEYARNNNVDYLEKTILQNAKCLSACAYAFIGGAKRVVEDDNVIGVHQFRSVNMTQTSESDAQTTTAQLSIYVNSMGVSPDFMTLTSLTPPNEITYLGVNTARLLKLDNINYARSDWIISATKEGLPVLSMTQQISEFLTTKINILVEGQRLLVGATTIFNTKEIRSDRLNQFPINEMPRISFQIDNKEYKGTGLRDWTKTESVDSVFYSSVSVFPRNMLLALQLSKSISISDDFGRATADVSLSTNLSTAGLQQGAALLSRIK